MRLTILVQQNVPRFNVSMQDAMFVGVMNSARQLRDEFRCAPNRHWFALATGRVRVAVATGFDDFIEFSAFHQAHAEVAAAVRQLPDLMNRNDERVVKAGGGFCLEAKASKVRFRSPMPAAQNF